jgi:hypothetical protein
MSFSDDIKINKNTLDKDAINQVDLYEEWSRKWAEAVNARDRLKEVLSVTRAEADEEIRQDPSKFGWTAESKAPTEAWISNAITLHPNVRKATDDLLNAQSEVNLLSVAKETLEHRKKALEILTELYRGNYFVAVAKEDVGYKDAISKEGKEAHNEILNKSDRLRRRKVV